MTVAKEMTKHLSIRRALSLAGLSHNKWYHKQTPRNILLDKTVAKAVQEIGVKRPTYGTRRMAADASRELGRPINRKQIQRIFHKLGWIEPRKTKKQIMASKKKLARPTAPNQLWQTDMTYIWCGVDGWCYCFNVVDVFTRKWISYSFDVTASKDAAIESIVNAIAAVKPDCSKLIIRTDNGSQYVSRKFREAIVILGARQEFIWYHTPQQNGHVESFHKTLKKEYLWPHEFANYQDAEVIIAKAFADYNNSRIHSSLGYVTPNEFIKKWEMRNR